MLQADFSLLPGASSAHPDHSTARGEERFGVEDNFDQLFPPKVETSAQPKAFFRGIEHEAGGPLLVAIEIDH
jgi:hypothetical protein